MNTNSKIGCDIVCIARFEKSIEKEKFIEKVFHPIEIETCEKKVRKAPSYAVRFAAKEAFAKAIGTGLYREGLGPKDIWIENDGSGKPSLCVSNKLKDKLKSMGVIGWDVSLSHHQDYALATVLIQTK